LHSTKRTQKRSLFIPWRNVHGLPSYRQSWYVEPLIVISKVFPKLRARPEEFLVVGLVAWHQGVFLANGLQSKVIDPEHLTQLIFLEDSIITTCVEGTSRYLSGFFFSHLSSYFAHVFSFFFPFPFFTSFFSRRNLVPCRNLVPRRCSPSQ
jgi:hypothetical protein